MKKKRTGLIVTVIILTLLLVFSAGRFVMKKKGIIPSSRTEAAGQKESSAQGGGRRPGFLKSAVSDTEEKETVFAVNTTPAVLGPIADYLKINGEIISASSVDVYADTQGILAELYVSLGDYVKKDRVIAEVDPSRPGLNYAFSPVKARVTGTVTSVNLDKGDLVTPQIPVVTIGDLSHLQVAADIPERYISRIYKGMPAKVYLEAWPEQAINAKVTEINPVVDPVSRTMRIKMDLPTGTKKAKAGMYAEIRLTTEEKDNVVKIPADCVLRRFDETFVFVVNGDKAEKRTVVTGITLNGTVEITSGLKEGENVVYQGQTLLEDGVKVRVIRSTEAVIK